MDHREERALANHIRLGRSIQRFRVPRLVLAIAALAFAVVWFVDELRSGDARPPDLAVPALVAFLVIMALVQTSLLRSVTVAGRLLEARGWTPPKV